MSDFELEQFCLKETKDKLRLRRKSLVDKLEKLNGEKLQPEIFQTLFKAYNREILNIDNHIEGPYFAKLKYYDSKEEKDEELYLGKVGFVDEKNDFLVIDWRAPISTLYYDSEIGHVSYNSPEGVKTGELKLKRQIVIEDGKLQSISDSDLMTNDELLKPYLNNNSDKRLKSIIATIQTQQNRIIRAPRKNMIIQGIAGSGKTTVALHRISYLIYQMKKFDSTVDFLIIGPNKLFLQYISAVLPDLETNEVSQYTYEEIAKEVVGEKFEVLDKNSMFYNCNKQKSNILKIKTSKRYKELIDEFLFKEQGLFLPNNIKYKDYVIFTKDELEALFEKTKNYGDIQKLLFAFAGQLSEKLRDNKYSRKIIENIKEKTETCGKDIPLKDIWAIRNLFEKGCKEFLKKQLSIKKISILNIYLKFLDFLKSYTEFNELTKETSFNLKRKCVDFEDLPVLIYLKQRILPCEKFVNICHVIIDEAQDFGIFHFQALDFLFNESIFDLYGDLNQSIYGNSSIQTWQEIGDCLFNDGQYYELTKSYRTTVEIMEAANLLSEFIPLVKGEPVIRHGEKVCAYECDKLTHVDLIKKFVLQSNKIFNTVAILCNNPNECKEVKTFLSKANIESIILGNESLIKGLIITTIYEAKGLEFDSVIIYNASKESFNENEVVDMKLLYVAMTRAMHDLKILSKGEITTPLKTLLK